MTRFEFLLERIEALERSVASLEALAKRHTGAVPHAEFVNVNKACEIARRSRRTIYNWIADGRLPIVKRTLSGHPLIRATDLFVFDDADQPNAGGAALPDGESRT